MDEKTLTKFYEMVDEFINLANRQSENHSSTRVSSVIMFASARYNAFNFFLTDGEKENEENAIDYYCEQFRLVLQDNFEEIRHLHSNQNEKN